MSVRERILAIRIMEKLRKFPEQADALGIVAVNSTSHGKCRTESKNKLLQWFPKHRRMTTSNL